MPALLLVLLGTVACAPSTVPIPDPTPAAPAAVTQAAQGTIELRVGTSAPLPGTEATLTFVRVREDSRCPTGVTCIWEGDAVVELRVQPRTGQALTVELHTNPGPERQASAFGVTISLERLEPYPDAGNAIAPDAYRLTLAIAEG
jgi:hypothetical protein